MRRVPQRATLEPMSAADGLLGRISTLLESPESRDDAAQLERILTDGYAHALSLEAETWRLQKQLGKATAAATRGDAASHEELSRLATRLEAHDGTLEQLRALLVRLRERHSLAASSARARAAGF
jgi:hypothetical protein